MRTPTLFRTAPFRLTLLFLALFTGASSVFVAYVYIATAGEVARRANATIDHELISLDTVFRRGGVAALNETIIERSGSDKNLLYLLRRADGEPVSGTIGASPFRSPGAGTRRTNFYVTSVDPDGALIRRSARAAEQVLPGGWRLLVGVDTGESQGFVNTVARAAWGAGAITLLLGLAGGLLVSRYVARRFKEIIDVVDAARSGDLAIRAHPRGTGDEFDLLSNGLNEMLARLERSMGGLRHAGDAIAHDLRSPLTRLRAQLEASVVELRAGRGEPDAILRRAIDNTDTVIRTFATVLSIARLEAAGEPPDQSDFNLSASAEDVAELYAPVCEEKNVELRVEVVPGLTIRGSRAFISQAVANVLDNAVKYTPSGGAITLRVRRRASGDVEISTTDTGPGIPAADRERVIGRFVRLQSSRSAPGVGLGLSLVAAVVQAHGGRLELDDGPSAERGLRVALVLPKSG